MNRHYGSHRNSKTKAPLRRWDFRWDTQPRARPLHSRAWPPAQLSPPPPKKADDGIAAAGLVPSPWHCLGIAWPPRPARTLIVTLFSDPNEQLASERTTVAWCGRSNRDRIAATWRVVTVNSKRQNQGERGRGEGLDFHMRQTLNLLILIGSRFRMKSDSDVWPNLLDSIYQRDSSTAGSEEKLSSQYYLSAEQQRDG